ncbi:hypothetical protein GCM10007939_23590 [Amylibacter marinus]|uniref:Peptidase M16 C-terminal domain-containing protein n=1 Tax=Amylibacter marinus TaxID=1475483 RepID=A0ABQ5VXK4_9RHOB|nr:insulinase family protein [Amylibacter marinus]GLQ36075.1 hypothetical protein GCM10007939_23590 [Amylibacter marinus]
MKFTALFAFLGMISHPALSQEVIELEDIAGLHSAYVIPIHERNRVDVQVIILSGTYDEGEVSGIAHYTEHLAALSADKAVLQQPRQRDLNASTSPISIVHTNSGTPDEIDKIMSLSRAVLDTPELTVPFQLSEIDIVKREVFYKERVAPIRWLRRRSLQNLYGATSGRAEDPIGDIEQITIEGALDFHAQHYTASNTMIIISGDIDPSLAQQKLSEYFGDTETTRQVPDTWLDLHPTPGLHHVEKITSDRLLDDSISFSKFFEFPNPEDVLSMQASFFIASDIYNSHLNRALYLEGFIAQNFSQGSYLAVDGDLEYNAFLVPFEGVSLEEALAGLETAIANLQDATITSDEIAIARAKNVAYTKSLENSPRAYLDFFQNLGSDGLPPVSPSQFSQMIKDAPDSEVLRFIEAFASNSPTAAVLAKAN